jgi:hypothetical protein
VSGLPDTLRQQARAWAEETAAAQGFPVRVERAEVLRSVAVLLGSDQARESSGAPDGRKPRRVEAVEAPPAWTNDDMIEDGGDDLLLPG